MSLGDIDAETDRGMGTHQETQRHSRRYIDAETLTEVEEIGVKIKSIGVKIPTKAYTHQDDAYHTLNLHDQRALVVRPDTNSKRNQAVSCSAMRLRETKA